MRGRSAFKGRLRAVSRPWHRLVLATAAVVDDCGRVLLVRRHEPGLPQLDGHLELPGGKLEAGEKAAQAAMREVFEETGVRALAREIVGEPYEASRAYADHDVDVFIVCFLCTPGDHAPAAPHRPPEKVADVGWVPLEEVDPLALQSASLQFLAALVRRMHLASTLRSAARLVLRDANGKPDYALVVEGCLSDENPLLLQRVWRQGKKAEPFARRDDLIARIDQVVRSRGEDCVVSRWDPRFPLTPALGGLPVLEQEPSEPDFVLF